MIKESQSFRHDERSKTKIRCNVGLTIEPYGYRQGQRIATITLDDNAEEMSLKEIVLAIYRLKTNCITIMGESLYIDVLIQYLQKFINYCKINLNLMGRNIEQAIKFNMVLTTYDTYVEGMDESDTIVLIANNLDELLSAQKESERFRREYKFAGKIYIVHPFELDSTAYEAVLNTSIHFKTKYQRMY